MTDLQSCLFSGKIRKPARGEGELFMDSDWLGQLVDRHAAALELFARQWCDTPEDVVQEAFVKLAPQRTLPENPAAWLFRVVRNGGSQCRAGRPAAPAA